MSPHGQYRIEVHVNDIERHASSARLLIPVPPDAPGQCSSAIFTPQSWRTSLVHAADGKQRAIVAEVHHSPHSIIGFDINLIPSKVFEWPTDDCKESNETSVLLPADLLAAISNMIAKVHDGDLQATYIASYVASRFEYGPKADRDVVPQLTCSIQTGNCVDIHGVFLAALRSVGIPAKYYAGYLFPTTPPYIADGMHCWVSMRSGHRSRTWDLAYNLKIGATEIQPDQDPIPALRIAMSHGLGIYFHLDGRRYFMEHFAQPRWLLSSSEATKADTTAHCIHSERSHSAVNELTHAVAWCRDYQEIVG